MEDNLFTIFWWLLPYINMNHPRMHMCLPILNTPSPRSSPPHPSILIEIVLKLSIHLEELTLLLCCLQIYKHSIALHLSRSLFWCFFVLFCFFSPAWKFSKDGKLWQWWGSLHLFLALKDVFLPCFRRDSKSDPCYSVLDRWGSLQAILSSPCTFIFKL